MKKLLLAAVLTCACAFADGDYVAYQKSTLSSAATALTVQQPASASKTVTFRAAVIICDSTAKCDFTLERDGTAATATAGTAVGLTSVTNASKATVFTASNAGAGALAIPYTIPAGGVLPIELSRMRLFGDGTAKNVTLRVASMTGTITLQIYFSEN